MEVNDTNPLNNLRFTLKNSGKYMVDAVILFSSNINYDKKSGQVYLYHNPQVQTILDNREKYIKPLKDRGMKVILSILGNHDAAAINNLSDETARLFAAQVKACCDAYDLDGVFYDDEYSNTALAYGIPGFVNPSKDAASRLVYEIWKQQPERWNIAYVYNSTYGLNEVDGVPSGVYCQYALHDYGGSTDLATYFPGMPRSNMGLYSQQFRRGSIQNESNLRRLRDNGYGSMMIFAMNPFELSSAAQERGMGNMARAFYDDEVVVDPTMYDAEWVK